MNDQQLERHIFLMNERSRRFTRIFTVFFAILLCLELYRLFILDRRVTYLWQRVAICEKMPKPYSKKELHKVRPGAYDAADSTYNNVAGDENHHD